MKKGSASLMVLIMGVVASIMVGGLIILTGTQYGYSSRKSAGEEALALAEAGLNFYRWRLAHDPTGFTDSGEHVVNDPQGSASGKFVLDIVPPPPGSKKVTVTSTGWTSDYSLIKRSIRAEMSIPSLARFSFLSDNNMWFGSGIWVHGRIMSNGGIRMDGINDSLVQSYQQWYTCGSESGCVPSASKSGVWGSGGPSELWRYPVSKEDFTAVSINFREMSEAADTLGTHFLPNGTGYHMVFNANGTVSVYQVNSTNYYRGYDSSLPSGQRCATLYQRIASQTLVGTYALSEKPVFFVEDTLWIEGVVNGHVTVAAARLPIDTYNIDAWINNSITYAAKDGNHSLGLIAQRNILFVKDLPDTFEVDAALLAQKGRIFRHNYASGWTCSNYANAVRDRLIIYGSVISGLKSGWNYGTPPSSGFRTRDVTYDPRMQLTPPPYFPSSGDYVFVSWNEVANP